MQSIVFALASEVAKEIDALVETDHAPIRVVVRAGDLGMKPPCAPSSCSWRLAASVSFGGKG
jgi:hypothetical protein